MVHVKKMVMTGFKSFARRTEIIFDKGINVILGPNGSGKSNVADALCFVLGRLSIKSMRAAKARNLLFMGSKYIKPAKEASVELVFDNSDKAFAVAQEEVNVTRVVRHNGQSIYKINGEAKTRAEVIELLAQAGIDPYGFNLILQGQIQSIVRMHGEERRKIIEDVAGISIYESRKEKSLHELAKTEEKLREISTILRERTAYLKNLDRERSQALRFKELELSVRKCKISILNRKSEDKQKEIDSLDKSIQDKGNQKDKVKEKANKLQGEVVALSDEIQRINKSIQQATGLEQETLHSNVANLKAELEGLRVRRENHEHRKTEIERRVEEIKKTIPDLEKEIRDLRQESPLLAKKALELKKKKDEFASLEEERSKLLATKTELNSVKEILKDKERQLARVIVESEEVLKQLEIISTRLIYSREDECNKAISLFKQKINEYEKEMIKIREEMVSQEKLLSVAESKIAHAERIKRQVEKIDICPLCQNKITVNHIEHVFKESDTQISESQEIRRNSQELLSQLHSRIKEIDRELRQSKDSLQSAELELGRHRNIKDKHEQIKKVVAHEKLLKEEIQLLEQRRTALESKISNLATVQEKYDSKILEIEEISSRTAEDAETTLLYKERELEGTLNIIKRSVKDHEEIDKDLKEIIERAKNKSKLLQDFEEKERQLNERFKKMFEERDDLQRGSQEKGMTLSELQSEMRQIDDQINYLRLGKARADAEKEALTMEMTEFVGVEIISGSIASLEERLKKSQEALMQIGSINMRALEVYDDVKKEYDIVFEKVTVLEKEKIEIMKIVEEIDRKKIRAFMKTYKAMNDLFSQNFSKLSSKGVAFLEIENAEDIFAGGVNIVVKLAKGKYFDVTSLSGGEQTLVALSLLFAIQEYKPYHFYIFDEIDAALDKRNSERLAALLHQYMKAGQYIVITHNDSIIMSSNVLYGVSMHDGVSKVLSLKIDGKNSQQSSPPSEKTDSEELEERATIEIEAEAAREREDDNIKS
ncbi:chromosome segregation protein SMC [Candidatus Pacearchaeota archaeon]|nr:chromosome segregation protein SMC [Candidatus Pacearchaeota archaeon]